MPLNASEQVERRMRIADGVAIACSLAAIAIVSVVLFGWLTQTRDLVTFGFDSSTKPNVALALLVSALATIALVNRRYVLTRILSGVVVTYGGAVLLQWFTSVDLHIDNVLIHDFVAEQQGRILGRPAVETAAGVCLTGLTLWAASFHKDGKLAARLGYVTQLVVILASTQQLTGAQSLVPSSFVGHIALPSVITLGLLAVAAQCALARRAGQVYGAWGTESVTAQLRRIITVPVVAVAGTVTLAMVVVAHFVMPNSALVVARSGVVTLTLVLLTVWFMVERYGDALRTRLERLTQAATKVGTGRFDVAVPIDRHDEVGALTAAVDDMALALEQQHRLDQLARSVQRETGEHSDLRSAFAAFSDLMQADVPHRRAVFHRVEDDGIQVVAVHGELAAAAPAGTFMRFGVERVNALRAGTEPQLVREVPPGTPIYLPDVRSYIVVPVVVAGEVQAAVSFMSDVANHFDETHRALAVRVINDVAGTFHHLFLLEMETDARRQLDRLNRLRAEFVAVVAHDLRSPMSVIANMADMMERDWATLTDEEKIGYLRRMSRRTRSLSRFIEDALNVAKIDSGELEVDARPVDLVLLARRLTEDFSFIWPDRHIELHCDTQELWAMADEERQWRILSNLLGNAFSYSPPGTPVEVSIAVRDNMAEVSVTDHGVGIDHNEQSDIFEKFKRLPHGEAGEHDGGSGLGLYICRRLVETQGGTITLESTVGEGSTFTYTVPCVSGQRNASADEPSPSVVAS